MEYTFKAAADKGSMVSNLVFNHVKFTKKDNLKEAMDFTSIAPVKDPNKTLTDRELARALRMAIAAEHDAAHLYELIVDSTDNKDAKKLIQDIADEEKIHVGELTKLLNDLDEDNEELENKGKDEAEEKIGSEDVKTPSAWMGENLEGAKKKIKSNKLTK